MKKHIDTNEHEIWGNINLNVDNAFFKLKKKSQQKLKAEPFLLVIRSQYNQLQLVFNCLAFHFFFFKQKQSKNYFIGCFLRLKKKINRNTLQK